MKTNIIITTGFLAVIGWHCTKDDQSNLTLKESLELNSAKINTAFGNIAESRGYQLLSVNEDGTKSDFGDGFRDSIDLELIAGIYNFKPGTEMHHNFYFPFRLFMKTGNSEKLIINMPEKLAFHPKYLHFCDRADSVLKNNFSITANNYHFFYNQWNNSDYKLIADFKLNNTDLGHINMFSSWKSGTAGKYSREFTFPEGYTIIRSGETGDTTRIVFALAEDKDTLLKETLLFIGDGFKRKERQYILSIGNVDIKRSTSIDSIQVYLDGVLQKEAGIKIMDDGDYNSSVCYKRDIMLTFDDGTTAKLSELISPALETLKSVTKAMEEMYFSKHIIDYIALSIYYDNH